MQLEEETVMGKKTIILLSVLVLLAAICALWISGVIPKQIAKISAKHCTSTPSDLFSSVITDSGKLADLSVSWVNYGGSDEFYFGCLNAKELMVSSTQHLPIYKFESLAELDAFKEAFRDDFSMNTAYGDASSFEENTKKMDEAYFADKTVFLVYVTASSGSYRFGIKRTYRDADNFCIYVEQTNDPEVGTCDMAGWFLTLAVDKETVKDIETFDAVLQ